MHDDHGHVAMPKLYGAPAYARPPAKPVAPTERPFDPDDLPIESERTNEDEVQVAQVHADAPIADQTAVSTERDGKSASAGQARRLRIPRLGRARP